MTTTTVRPRAAHPAPEVWDITPRGVPEYHPSPLMPADFEFGPACFVTNRPRSGACKSSQVWTLPDEPGRIPTMRQLREFYSKRASRQAVELTFGSRGIPALPAPVRPNTEDKPVEEMTWQELRDSQDREIPYISQQAFAETGEGALSLDAPASFNDDDSDLGTLADAVPNDHWLRTAYADLFEAAIAGDANAIAKARDVYGVWIDTEAMARRYKTPRVVIDPATRERIRWERYTAQCSDISEHRGFRIKGDRIDFFAWPSTDRDTYLARKAKHVAQFLAKWDLTEFPTFERFIAGRNDIRASARNPKAIAEERWLSDALGQMEMARAKHTDDTAANSRDALDYPYVPSLALLTYIETKRLVGNERLDYDEYRARRDRARAIALREWLRLDEAAREEAEEAGPHHFCRNTRQHGSKDETWHGTMVEPEVDPPAVSLGWAGSE